MFSILLQSVAKLYASSYKEYVKIQERSDKREKSLIITSQGLKEINHIDAFSNPRIIGALDYLSLEDQQIIPEVIRKYANALEKSRLERENIKIHTLPSSRPIRNQIIHMIESIQKNEFSIPITPDINVCISKAEETFHYNNQCNFWYATNADGHIIGSIGLKRMDKFNGEVKKFFVHQDYRGKGTANKLIQKMLQAARKNGFHTLYLGTVSLLKAAQKFYEKVGFQQIEKNRLPMEFEICPLDSVFFKGSVREIAAYSIDE